MGVMLLVCMMGGIWLPEWFIPASPKAIAK
jgi:hypothetical protein